MTDSTIAFIGLGLIGGSIARAIRRVNPDTTIMAYMRTRSKLEQAQADGIIDIILDDTLEGITRCDLIFLCTPVEYNAQYLSSILPLLKPGALITDVGSTKTDIHDHVIRLGLEDRFVGGHPMAGSEKTGYENSTDRLLENAYYIITPTAASTDCHIQRLIAVANTVGAIPMVLDYQEHDFITAAVSHLPHVVASSLVNLVKDSDGEQELMKRLAAGGFKDITRIASSSPKMWEQICMTNKEHLAVILERYIDSLTHILGEVKAGRHESLYELFDSSKTYRNTISERVRGSVSPEYFFTIDVVDEPGSISTLSVILASRGISIKNIGINHNREHGEGVLGISFYDEESMNRAWQQLEGFHYALKGTDNI